MKIHPLRTATIALMFAAGIAPAQAVMLNPHGMGQALIYPYYTVNRGLDTLISIDNDSNVGKLVKLRFMEGYNGRTVLDFNVYLGAHDGWIGALSSDGSVAGGARLVSNDRSCTSPDLGSPAAFSTAQFDGSSVAFPADGGPTTAARTREGHFEVIAIGDIRAQSATAAALHEFRCDQIPADPASDLVVPTPTLFGHATIIDVGNGLFYGYNATALSGFTDRVLSANGSGPTLADANSAASATPAGAIAAVTGDDGATVMLDYARGIDAVTAVFMVAAVVNEFNVMSALGAQTDWVMTFPTKRFYVDKQIYPQQPTQPFSGAYTDPDTSSVQARYQNTPLDHDALILPPRCPGTPDDECMRAFTLNFPFETSVIDFGTADVEASRVLGSFLRPPWPPHQTIGFDEYATGTGWVRLDFVVGVEPFLKGGLRNLPSGPYAVDLVGMPVSGFMVYNIVNANAAPGKLANYGGAFPHRAHAPCVVNPGTDCPVSPR